jgi:ectoine hydroxylase-related dioxygenase (phytanoyl-CoA dioxygenase family)
MLVNRTVVPYLDELLGPGFRLDHNLGILTMRKGAEGHVLHGSSGPGFDRHQYYIVRDGRMHNGLTVVAYQLTDVNPGDGGLCVVPGSHKGNFPCPEALRRGEAYGEFVKQITCKAGDCVIFTEAVTHGTLPWTADHQRRTALLRFSPGNLAYVPHAWPAEMLALMSPEQRLVMEPPYHPRLSRPVLQVEGEPVAGG